MYRAYWNIKFIIDNHGQYLLKYSKKCHSLTLWLTDSLPQIMRHFLMSDPPQPRNIYSIFLILFDKPYWAFYQGYKTKQITLSAYQIRLKVRCYGLSASIICRQYNNLHAIRGAIYPPPPHPGFLPPTKLLHHSDISRWRDSSRVKFGLRWVLPPRKDVLCKFIGFQ